VRELVDAVVSTEVETEELERCAAQVGALTEALSTRRREREARAAVDDLLAGVRMYNPVIGAGSPLAPPLEVERGSGTAVASCELGLAYEGPPTYVHGGVSALLADQVLGAAAAASGNPGMTTELTLRYRRPVPLRTPLVVSAETVDVSGRWVRAVGTIAATERPDRPLVEAQATFACLSPDQARRLFPR
jgi:acyl-coenzyme A thioesterase PaaI-like protein